MQFCFRVRCCFFFHPADRQIESLTFQTTKEALSFVCEVDIRVEPKMEINEVQEETSTQTQPLPELKSIGVTVQIQQPPVTTQDFLNVSH